MDTAARARIATWKQSLLDRSERLIDVADHGVSIVGDPVRLVFSLVAGTPFQFEAAKIASLEVGRVRVALGGPELASRVAGLRRAARDASAEGEQVLWLAIGTLAWVDRAAVAHVSPLVLWPVELVRRDGATRLVAAPSRAPRLNDVLAARLRSEYDVAFDTGAELDLAATLDRATALCTEIAAQETTRTSADGTSRTPSWRVERVARLGAFSFAAFDMWRDLEALGDELYTSAPLGWLAGDGTPPAVELAETELVAPLDADFSQLDAVAAAAAGSSFVLQGAPGTGKSQTIANLAVQCASDGKSVLVVSDRATALATIRRRLDAVGLADFCSGRAAQRASRPVAGPNVGGARLADLAASLDGHVVALHRTSGFGMSVHAVLGRLTELRTTPRAALAEADAPSLDRATYERRRRAVTELAEAGAAVEPVAAHPWRASSLDRWPADGTDRAMVGLVDADDAIAALATAIAEVATFVPGLVTRTPEQLRAAGAFATLAAASPRPGAELLTNLRSGRLDEIGERVGLIRARGGGAIDVPRDPTTFIAIAVRHRALIAEVEASFTDAVANLDATELWTQLKRWTTSMAPLRYVALRTARGAVREATIPSQLATDEAMITALEAVIAERACRAALVAAAEPARRWFGELAPTGETLGLDLDKIEAAIAWAAELRRAFDQVAVNGGEVGRQAAWRALVAQVAASPDGQPATLADRGDLVAFARLADAVARWEPILHELSITTGLPMAMLGAGPDHLAALRVQLDGLIHAVGSLGDWTRFQLARRSAIDAGLRNAIVAIERGDLAAAELATAWERATLLAWLDATIARTPSLSRFSGSAHHASVSSFADLDRGALAVVRNRLPRLAPCVLATPHEIAREALPVFDVVVFDEASRIPVSHALGALARARSVIVVGDSRQPAPADGADGLLDTAVAAGFGELALAAHYRSRHHDLFAFANRRYYGERIEVLPAAQRTPELGLSWRPIDGVSDVTGANRAEAEAIIADVVAKLRDPSHKRSIAVVALSCAQQQLLEDLLDDERMLDRTLDTAIETGDEPLLIGTPDRLQGEERDLVFVSVGDSADALGALAHPCAERWLDVAVTRAREQLVVMSSFAPEAVPTDAPSAARGLAELLAFARDGGTPGTIDAVPASPITAAIGRALEERGWMVRHQVGTGAYRIDLAIVDREDPDKCVLAIEHDGLAYASGPAARDRDRLRAQVLGQLGWRLHRIWSLDWWAEPEREIQRAHGAIVAAIAAGRQRRIGATAPVRRRLAAGSTSTIAEQETAVLAAGSGPTDAVAVSLVDHTTPLKLPRGAIAIGPYTAAAIPAGRRLPGDMFAARHVAELGKVVEQVLAAEAPIHLELLARRVGAYFGVGRVTPRIAGQVRAAIEGRGRFGDEQDVVWRLDQDPSSVPPVRVAGASAVACRDISEIPLSELAAAARIVVERAAGLSATELVRDCARLLGFARLTDKVTERVTQGVQLATVRELITIENGRAHLDLR